MAEVVWVATYTVVAAEDEANYRTFCSTKNW
jgi:hypothetical protein